MDVLIIGGTGLISTGITRQLVAAGHDVTVFNRGESEARIPDAVERIHGDRFDHDAFESRMADVDTDAVIDMFAFDPAEAESDVRAFGGRIDQLVFCSTVDVYHRPVDSNPVTEDAPRAPPVSEYGENKAACEDVLLEAAADGAFETTVIRPWHTYGEGGTVNHTFGNDTYYLDRLRRGLPVVVHGDGSGVWGPCHRDDVARAFVSALGNEAAYGEAYHVTSEETMAWDVYHRKVADAIGAPDPELVHIPTDLLLEADPERTEMLDAHFQYSTVFDNAKAKRDLDFQYTVPWRDGVRRTVEFLEERDRIEDADDEPRDDILIDAWRDAGDSFVGALDDYYA